MPLTVRRGGQDILPSMVQEIEIVMKKVWYVGFVSDNKGYLCKYNHFGRWKEIALLPVVDLLNW